VILQLQGGGYFPVMEERDQRKSADWLLPWSRAFEVRRGKNDLTFSVTRGCGVAVTLMEKGTPVGLDAFVFVSPVAPPERIQSQTWGRGHQRWCAIDTPGLCTLTVNLPGYEPIPKIELNIPPRTFLERVIEVHRRH